MPFKIPSNIYSAVKPYSGNVPDAIWEDVAYIESGFNANAYNKAGAYGLFQLLYPGGQGDAAITAGHTPNDLFKPSINAEYAMPAISRSWSSLGSSFDNSLIWWEKFAAESGHPGGSPGQSYTDQVAQQLKDNYQGGNEVSSNPWSLFWNNVFANLISPGSAFGDSSSASAKASDIVGKEVQDVANNTLITTSHYIVVFILAIVFIIIGFMVLIHE